MSELHFKEMYFAAGVKKITGPYVGPMHDNYEEALGGLEGIFARQ